MCKHILFVLLRVLNLSPEDPLVWQKALLSGEVDEVGGAAVFAGMQERCVAACRS